MVSSRFVPDYLVFINLIGKKLKICIQNLFVCYRYLFFNKHVF